MFSSDHSLNNTLGKGLINGTTNDHFDMANFLASLILLLLFLTGMFTNSVAFIVLVMGKYVCYKHHCFIFSLVIANSLFVLAAMPLATVKTLYGFWPFSADSLCVSFIGSRGIFAAVSTYHVAVITLYRSFSVIRPFIVRRLVKTWPIFLLISVIWIVPFLLWFAPIILGYTVVESDGNCQGSLNIWLRMYYAFAFVWIPLFVVLIANYVIFQTLRLKRRFTHNLLPSLAVPCIEHVVGMWLSKIVSCFLWTWWWYWYFSHWILAFHLVQ